jgi:hypothetical protein
MVVAARKSALRPQGASLKPKRSVMFSKRARTFCVKNSYYPTPLVSGAYANHRSGSKGPVLLPEHTEETLAQALADAQAMAQECEADGDAIGCVYLLHYKFRNNSHYLNTYYNETCSDAQREDRTGDWRAPDSDSDDLDAALATIEPDPSV